MSGLLGKMSDLGQRAERGSQAVQVPKWPPTGLPALSPTQGTVLADRGPHTGGW